MDALGFAAVVDGKIDPRTVSSDAYNARRLALYWVFTITTKMDTPESYVEFLWNSSVALMVGRDPERTVAIVPVVISVDDREVVEPELPPNETMGERITRLTPRS